MSLAAGLGWGAAALAGLLTAYGLGFTLWARAAWPAEGRIIETAHARVHVRETGAGPLVVALHGASANSLEMWAALGPSLGREYRFIAMDRPGQGHSTRPANAHLLAVQAEAAAAVVEDAASGPAILVAHSLGAATALRLAIDRPDLVRGLVLAAPASHPYPGGNAWHTELAATPVVGWAFSATLAPAAGPILAESAIGRTFAPAEPPKDYARQSGLPLLFRPAAFRANARDVVATRREFALQAPHYPTIAAPAIILTADHDTVVSPRLHAHALARELPAAELVTLPGTGHMPHRIRPDAVAAAVERIARMTASPEAD